MYSYIVKVVFDDFLVVSILLVTDYRTYYMLIRVYNLLLLLFYLWWHLTFVCIYFGSVASYCLFVCAYMWPF